MISKKCEKCGAEMRTSYYYDEQRGSRSVLYCPKGCNSTQKEIGVK